ncbi:cytochrome P450 6B1-like [Pectinophora gossypiella]|uniref:cytochrome P450 6B1-like n=1 Tax=Pectinophora gossypiella TaxID=13191 RepID=UPI00214E3340|nr:cytochrome P450 6B1-like [Pectinophora gossypiella]XP_049871414.1 cytochrome P450 6B1-like [Pectinophora gossypiella]XP_049871415.1 cytochrome P450 6B1-like [Pectinophora gossypiella]XP_049871416.1 cytochrome P450 6B1-like [Pectinophora gossypiella]
MGFKWSMVQLVLFLAWALQYCTFGSPLLWYFLATCLGVACTLALTTYDHDYWATRGVFAPPAWPLVGHIASVVTFKEQGGLCFKRIYDTYKNERFLGTHQFYQRTLVIRDPELIKRVCVNDFQYFVDRGFFFNKKVDPLAGSVLFLRGNEWRKLRAKISPIFSPNKLRGMFPLIEDTAKEFVLRVRKLISQSKSPEDDNNNNPERSVMVDSEKLVGGYTADAIVPCAFGLKSNVMDNEKDPFAVALHAFYEMSLFNIFEKTMRQFWPAFVLFFRMRIIPKRTHDFFYNIVTSVLRARENGTQEKRGDFIDMMMSLRDEKTGKSADDNDVEITDVVISANAFIIFLGGFETTSSTLAFLLLELAANPHVQEKMRAEILQVLEKNDGNVTYEMLQELTYMEMVIQETLRLYPPFPSIQRMCTKDYQIPGSKVTVERGTIVLFPTLGIQRDEQYFESAGQFVPERWAEGRPAPPPGVYMPFGDGPRYCIGKRFAMIQMKCCLVRVLQAVRVRMAHDAPARDEPFPADPRFPLTLHPVDSRLRISLL